MPDLPGLPRFGGQRWWRGVERPLNARVRLVREKGESGAVVPVEGDTQPGCSMERGLSAAVSKGIH